MSTVKVLVLRAPGTNCDNETAFAFEQAGAVCELHHVNRLISRDVKIAGYQIMVIPGGFSYGDDIAAGKIQANEMKARLGDDIQRFIESSGLMLGICNGFQMMAKAGWLNPPDTVAEVAARLQGRERQPAFTLTNNDSGRFECRWIHMIVNPQSNCVFTRGIERLYLPIAHGEGKVVAEPEELAKLNVALRYCNEKGETVTTYPDNPNGSMDNIAGIADETGRIFALMPHPERHIRGTQNPMWTRNGISKAGDGLPMFSNAVKWVKGS